MKLHAKGPKLSINVKRVNLFSEQVRYALIKRIWVLFCLIIVL